jgi:hypothetical protein
MSLSPGFRKQVASSDSNLGHKHIEFRNINFRNLWDNDDWPDVGKDSSLINEDLVDVFLEVIFSIEYYSVSVVFLQVSVVSENCLVADVEVIFVDF